MNKEDLLLLLDRYSNWVTSTNSEDPFTMIREMTELYGGITADEVLDIIEKCEEARGEEYKERGFVSNPSWFDRTISKINGNEFEL